MEVRHPQSHGSRPREHRDGGSGLRGAVMTYEKLVEARERRTEKELAKVHRAAQRRKGPGAISSGVKRTRMQHACKREHMERMRS